MNYVHDYGSQLEGFVNANTGTDDYDYDFSGNMDKDKNKGMSVKGNIKYNHLNLPEEVIKGTESIKYIYDASGRKLRQEVYSNNGGTLVKYTEYVGELVYEGGNLQFIQHAEGRVLPDGANWEYQYHLKDHLGNVRVTFTTKPQSPVNHSANLENGNGGSGEGVFGNYSSTVYDLVDHTDAGTTYQRVQWLNGGASGRVGLTKSLSVMPGDRVSATAYAKYMNLSGTGNTNVFATALTTAFGVSSGSTGEQLKLYNNLNAYGVSVAGGDHPDDDDAAPKAFITILLFDRDYNLLDAAWDQVTTDLEQVSANAKEAFDYPLSKEVIVQEAGYAYIFLSNEHPTYVDVYFDDVMVSHTLSPIVSSADYYPCGLTFNSHARENSLPQNYLYNGKELQDELSLGWLDHGARMYMPDIGRWSVDDPLAVIAPGISPYAYCYNSPVNYTDPTGMYGEKDMNGRERHDSFTGQYIAPMDRRSISQDPGSTRNDTPRDGRRREITNDDVAASYRLQEYGTDIYSRGELISHTPEGYYLIPVSAQQEGYRARMSREEIAIFDSMEKDQQFAYLSNANYALSTAQDHFHAATLHNGRGDAFRHALFSALNSRDLGIDLAKRLGDAHELHPAETPLGREMDLFNNDVGRKIFTLLDKRGLAGHYSTEGFVISVMVALEGGFLREIGGSPPDLIPTR